MKKIFTIIVCLLCAVTASALSYASPYKGAGRSGYVYATSSARMHEVSSSGLAQAPVASMAATGRMSTSSRGIAYAGNSAVATPTMAISGIRTSASSLRGGQLSTVTYAQMHGPYKSKKGEEDPPPNPGCKHCVDENEDDICDVCGHDLLDGCTCRDCHCDVPLTTDKEAWLFMAALAAAYAIYRNKVSKQIEIQNI